MKVSFYICLWVIVDYLVRYSGNQSLVQNAFVVCLLAVLLVRKLDKELFAQEIQYQSAIRRYRIFEIYYSNDTVKMLRVVRKRFYWQLSWAVYSIFVAVGLYLLQVADVVVYAVLALMVVLASVISYKSYSLYRTIKKDGLPEFDKSQFPGLEAYYRQYCELREHSSARNLRPKAPSMSGWISAVSILFAVGSIVIGFYGLSLALFESGNSGIVVSVMLVWVALSLYFGIKDLIDSVVALWTKPMLCIT